MHPTECLHYALCAVWTWLKWTFVRHSSALWRAHSTCNRIHWKGGGRAIERMNKSKSLKSLLRIRTITIYSRRYVNCVCIKFLPPRFRFQFTRRSPRVRETKFDKYVGRKEMKEDVIEYPTKYITMSGLRGAPDSRECNAIMYLNSLFVVVRVLWKMHGAKLTKGKTIREIWGGSWKSVQLQIDINANGLETYRRESNWMPICTCMFSRYVKHVQRIR